MVGWRLEPAYRFCALLETTTQSDDIKDGEETAATGH